ncbi:MAG TPA: DUF1343 domain-containing protein [Bdellovibrionota bacterium]|nr:DUF1343 domain-containing protein [Bdellovibrionota bacterium]
MQLGIDRLLSDAQLRARLKGKRIALLAHPASMTRGFLHSVDALAAAGDLKLSAAFGPQHGMRGEKQDNMIESEDYLDPKHGIPVFSLYGKTRRPTEAMLDHFDVLLVDIQDVGCRIYTFLTTLLYVLEACASRNQSVWVLDRPNPAGRPVEGMLLRKGWESFVGADQFPMRHGLTLGEAARWFVKTRKITVDLQVVAMRDYDPTKGPGYGWPLGELPWVNPSPNAASLSMARCYAGTVMVEGTTLSEGRGTTRPLETLGAPDLDMVKIHEKMLKLAPEWMKGAKLRLCFFEPTFHKHQKQLNRGFQLHVDDADYDHVAFKPYRLVSLWFKAIRLVHPSYEIWRDFPYEYETDRLAIDLINGSPLLREWVDDAQAMPGDLEKICRPDEEAWEASRREFLLYP